MFSAASKGERRNLRGSARFSSKMSGRLSRLRALRPRSQQQRVRTAVVADATRKLEANLKEMTTNHEEENTVAKKCDVKRTEKGADIASTVSEMDDNDDDELTMITSEKNEEAVRDDDDIAINSEETTNFETSQQDSYECKSCKPSKTLPNMTAYLEHLQKEHKWNLERHMRNHGGGGAFKCRACNFTADIRQSLTVHESYHHDPPVGQVSRKSHKFERKPRNSPKRYNQVGASDFREVLNKTGNTTNSADSFIDHSLISIDDKKSALASAECIALKCEEQGCQFVTAWDSEMQRHLAESHTPPKPKKPLPSLIPLNIANSKPNTANSGPPSTLLKVPRVRVRPELAQIARDTELAKMYGNKQTTNSKRDLNNAADMFEKKNASFFDKLKEKLTTSTSINNGVPEVAVSSVNDLKCWCTFKASSMEELACHKQTHHTALSVSVGTTRCPKCRRRCKSTSDLQVHMQCCHLRNSSSSIDNSLDKVTNCSDICMTSYTGEHASPSQMDWDINFRGPKSLESSVEQQSWDEDHMEEHSTREINSDEPPTKVVIVDKEYSSTVGQSSVTILPSNETNQNSRNVNVSLRPPPPLKAAVKNRGQSLLRNNPITMQIANDNSSIAISTATDENKRTQWKCKRCNYRDCNKENVLLHVKSHYESTDQQLTEEKNPFGCSDCPFSASDAATLSLHRIHHRPNLEAIFKCYLCPYYVSTKTELLDHVRLHGEELAAIHKQNIDFELSSKCKQVSLSDGGVGCSKDETTFMEQMIQITSRNNVTLASKNAGVPPPPPSLLLDTRALPDVPMVWVSRPDGTLSKMLKCRHCPYVSSRRAEVREHETMHVDKPTQTPSIACTDCSFTCWHRDIMIAHTEMHAGSLGTVHCLVDETRPDAQQASDLATLLGMTHTPMLGAEPDLEESRLVHCCGKCPARFLCEKELRIHLRYHSTELAYSCQWCTYAARQATHLQAHQKAHSTEYQERTKYLLSVYGFSQRYPPPATACVEAETQESNDGTSNVAWIVVEMNDNANNSYGSAITSSLSSVQRTGNSQQVFTCAKCPARYFKLDALEYHMTLHGSNNRFKCNDCDYSSKTAQNLVKHQVVHRRHNETSEVTTSSSVTTVSSSASVSIASPLHSSPDPQFGIFMRGNPNFVYPGYLRNGRLKEKRYKCHKCPSAFEKREQYRVHLTLHGAKQRYRCNMCDYSVKYYANYIQHVKKHQANAQAQASRRQFEDDRISIDSDSIVDVATSSSRSSKSLRSSAVSINGIVTSSSGNNNAFGVANNAVLQSSNQDKQTLLLMQKKGVISLTNDADVNTIRCQSCPFFTTDKDTMDMHKRRHGIDRMTPPCPYCDYIPRKDENVNEHIQLHFTRLYKPESYLIVELLTLTIEKVSVNSKEDKNDSQRMKEVLFKECADGRFLPLAEPNSLSLGTSSIVNTLKEKITVDPNTGETKHHLV